MCIFVLFVKQVHIKKNIDGSLVVYAILLSWPEQPVQKLGVPIPSPVTLVSMLRFPNVINWNFGLYLITGTRVYIFLISITVLQVIL